MQVLVRSGGDTVLRIMWQCSSFRLLPKSLLQIHSSTISDSALASLTRSQILAKWHSLSRCVER